MIFTQERTKAIVGVVIVIVGIALALLIFGNNLKGIRLPSIFGQPELTNGTTGINGIPVNITLSGKVGTTAQGDSATSVEFRNLNTNQNYTTNAYGGQYSVVIPNGNPYSITVFWAGKYQWQNGFDTVDPFLAIGANASSATYNLNFSAPESTITLNGNATMDVPNVTSSGIIERTPSQIIFESEQGEQFSVDITSLTTSNQGSDPDHDGDPGGGGDDGPQASAATTSEHFSLTLPNLMSYTVTIKYNGLYGSTGTCDAGTFDAEAGQWDAIQNQSFNC